MTITDPGPGSELSGDPKPRPRPPRTPKGAGDKPTPQPRIITLPRPDVTTEIPVVVTPPPPSGLMSRLRRRSGPGRTRTPAKPPGPIFAAILTLLVAITALTVWLLVYALFFTGIHEHRSQQLLYATMRSELAEETGPLGPTITPGAPVALLQIPAAGVHDAVVVEGTSSKQLENGPGHLPGSALPGQSGESVLYGRSVTFGAPFGKLTQLQAGDPIAVVTQEGSFSYRVIDIRYPGDAVPAAPAAGGSRLVLVSSVGEGWRAGWAPQHVVYVDASLTKGTVQAGPSGQPQPPHADLAMRGDTGAVVGIAFWLEGCLAVAFGVLWLRRRWGGWQLWIVAVPVALAVLWGTSGWLLQLTPNLI